MTKQIYQLCYCGNLKLKIGQDQQSEYTNLQNYLLKEDINNQKNKLSIKSVKNQLKKKMKQAQKNILFFLLLGTIVVCATDPSYGQCQIPASKLNGQTFKSIIYPGYDNDRFSGDVVLTIQYDTSSILSLSLKAKDSNSKQQEYVYTPLADQTGLNLNTNFQITRKLTGDSSNLAFSEIYHFIASCTETNGVLTNLIIKASFSQTLKESTNKTGFQYFELQSSIKISSSYSMLIKFSLLFLLALLF
ncbi:transmembrane protein, putative (macronuclear) [Tetrahymena thermophila SB210]|uniref:Transmembrane protein, putative n=1 Tax=Tetrahymena thermophila (strain SB210) TaxID=312017 RepID=Q23CJ0_TETTS|nr:transmembrane protein, putative [Tetrahymena thermophila SB210]EAR94290.2 transmembrane protein, putative [Tetrahymena thermophila SB210]|eukprot:XP_001014535.2 transmembrane protein, putative [Tetrahymena thermophila SB210]